MTDSTAIVLASPLRYEFVDSDMVGDGRCIRHAGIAKPGQLVDTPSLCGRVHVGTRFAREDEPMRDVAYPIARVATKRGMQAMFCQECLHIWRLETDQDVTRVTGIIDLRDQALEDLRKELAVKRQNCDRYEARVMELDKRMEAMRLMTRGDWCALKDLVDECCAKIAEAK